MPDDFGCYDEEVERRIKMSYNVYPRPKTPIKCHKPPAPAGPKPRDFGEHVTEFLREYVDEETELTLEIAEACRKAGIPTEGLNIPKPSAPKNVQIMSGTGWLGPG